MPEAKETPKTESKVESEKSYVAPKLFPSITQSDSSPETFVKPEQVKSGLFGKVTSSPSSASSNSSLLLKFPSSSSSSPSSTSSTNSDKTSTTKTSPASLSAVASTPVETFSTPIAQTPALSTSTNFQTPALTTPSLFGGLKSTGSFFGGMATTTENKTFNPSSLTFSFGTTTTAASVESSTPAPSFNAIPAFGAATTSASMFSFGR